MYRAIILSCFFLQSSNVAGGLPDEFEETIVVSGLFSPTAMEFAPDGRLFVCEQGGKLRVIKNGRLLATPFVSLFVDAFFERGLLGVAFDPDFSANGYVYVYYTTGQEPIRNRVSRFTASDEDPDRAAAGSEVVIIDDIPSDAGNHNGGAIHFGIDGMLYVAIGDGGDNRFKAQSLANLSGKLLRIDASNYPEIIPPDNPFVETAGARDVIWAYGLRNPFTFAIDPVTGRIHINDVGGGEWEEVNLGIAGANYGWPEAEGPSSNSSFENPIHAYPHNGNQAAITGGTFYRGNAFPLEYHGDYFFADYLRGFIDRLKPDNQVIGFATGVSGIVDLKVGPNGSLFFISIFDGTVNEIAFTGEANRQPKAVATGEPSFGFSPLTVEFDGGQSSDPDEDALNYRWSFGDGILSSGVTVSHTYEFDGNYTVILTVDDQRGGQDQDSVTVVVGSTPPGSTIHSPLANSLYSAGDLISYAGAASDPEDGALPDSALGWTIRFHHDSHSHPFLGPLDGVAGGSFEIPRVGETDDNVWYRIHLKATDSSGLSGETTHDIFPRKSTITIDTNPPGLQISVDGRPRTAPYSFVSVVGFRRTIGAITPQDDTYHFVAWSDSGALIHSLDTPGGDSTYVANFATRGRLLPDLKPWVGPSPGGLLDANIVVAEGETRLRFAHTTVNIGVGPLDVQGDLDLGGRQPAYQRIYYSDETFEDILVGEFVFEDHVDHNHFHFRDFAIYRLRAVTPEGGVGENVASSGKLTFCITDSDPYDLALPNAPQESVYSCEEQGISVGWGDKYSLGTFGQWIVIDGVPSGRYWLETEANPDRLLFETNYENNIERILIALDQSTGSVDILSHEDGSDQGETTPDSLIVAGAADARVVTDQPDQNFGSLEFIRVKNDDPQHFSFLKFTVKGLINPVVSAKLRLYVTFSGDEVGSVYAVSNNFRGTVEPWTEDGITANNSPILSGPPLSTLAGTEENVWLEFDLGDTIAQDGTYSFALRNETASRVEFSSREGAHPPHLVITTAVPIEQPYEETVTFEFPIVDGGWYLISLPVEPRDNALSLLFPDALAAFAWDFDSQSYRAATTLQPKRAYWIPMPVAKTVEIGGKPLDTYTSNYTNAGWDMIGSVFDETEVQDNGGIVAMFSWDQARKDYAPVQPHETKPLRGYWVLILDVPATITLGHERNPFTGLSTSKSPSQGFAGLPPAPPDVALLGRFSHAVPGEFRLSQNYPNPFNPETVIEYQLPRAAFVHLKVYTIIGREVRTLVAQKMDGGAHRITWNGRDDDGNRVASGLYFYRIQADDLSQTRKLLLLK